MEIAWNLLIDNKIILKSQQRFKSDYNKVYTGQINKIALSSNDNKRLQTFDKITTYPYAKNVFKVFQSEMLSKWKLLILTIMQMKKNAEFNLKWLHIPDHSYGILIIEGSGSGKNKCIIEFNKQPARYW